MKITYAITACNEHKELEALLLFLKKNIRKGDQVLIQLDENNYTKEVLEVCNLYTNFNHTDGLESQAIPDSMFILYPLDKDFSKFKNNIFKFATGDYIFQIDADEMLHTDLINLLPDLLKLNSNIDLFLVPRINTVEGITDEHIKRWQWSVNPAGWINFPDYQSRIYRNDPKIHWTNPVHERIVGISQFVHIPAETNWCLLHHKGIARQEKQNDFYETM